MEINQNIINRLFEEVNENSSPEEIKEVLKKENKKYLEEKTKTLQEEAISFEEFLTWTRGKK
jgi:hypothetical protein